MIRYRLLSAFLFGAAATAFGIFIGFGEGLRVAEAAVVGATIAGFVCAPTLQRRFAVVQSKWSILTTGVCVTCIAYVFGVLVLAWTYFAWEIISQRPAASEIAELFVGFIAISMHGMFAGVIFLVIAIPSGLFATWLFYLLVRGQPMSSSIP